MRDGILKVVKMVLENVTAEVCPHHFILTSDDIERDDPNYKMNPPLRTRKDVDALIEGLKEKKIAAAGLDVYEEEGEYFYEDKSDKIIDDDVLARLLSFNNVIVTSHQAFFTKEALHNIAETTLQNIEDFRCHRPLVNEVIL